MKDGLQRYSAIDVGVVTLDDGAELRIPAQRTSTMTVVTSQHCARAGLFSHRDDGQTP